MELFIINGPNLNLLGLREPCIYGHATFEDFFVDLRNKYPEVTFEYFQSNVEGELINKLHECGFTCDGIILNAGAYTHTSIALGDAVAAIKSPVIEVHITNILAREEFRHISYITSKALGCIGGLGLDGYRLAVEAFLKIK